ncbi:hypothetical protein PT2222_250007 [Paraburkholderia tropica]
MLKIVFEHALLDGDLGAHVQMLHRTAAAFAEVRTLRLGADRAFAQHAHDFRLFERRFLAIAQIRDAFARQCALDEDHLARLARFGDGAAHAARLHIERFNFENRGLSDRGFHGGALVGAAFAFAALLRGRDGERTGLKGRGVESFGLWVGGSLGHQRIPDRQWGWIFWAKARL